MSAKVRETAPAVERLLESEQELKIKISEQERSILNEIAKDYIDRDFVLIIRDGLTPDSVRKLTAQLIEKNKCICAVFSGNDEDSYKYAIGQKNGDIKVLIKDMNTALNGRGGGKPFFAQGSVSCKREEIKKFFSDICQ